MPFSPQNRKYTVTLIAIVAVAMVISGAVWGVSRSGGERSTPIVTALLGFGGLLVLNLFQLLKTSELADRADHVAAKVEEHEQKAEETRKVITAIEQKVNGDGAGIVQQVAAEVRQSERSLPADQVERLAERVAERVCGRMMKGQHHQEPEKPDGADVH